MIPKLVIIGQSPAAYAAIRALRAGGADHEIVLVPTDGDLPYDRGAFAGLVSRKTAEKDVFCAPAEFYQENKVEVIAGKELSKINFSRRKVYLADRVQVDYDALLITDAPQVRAWEVKGARRTGVFQLARLGGVRGILKHLPFVETAVVIPCSLWGVDMALALKGTGREVVLAMPGDKALPSALADSAQGTFLKLAEKAGLRVLLDSQVADILGEGETQAVRFKTGKVMACEMVVTEEAAPDLRFLEGSDLLVQERICVHTTMRTNIPDVYAADVMMELASPRFTGSYGLDAAAAMRQGECAAKAILGQEEHFTPESPDPAQRLESMFPMEALVRD